MLRPPECAGELPILPSVTFADLFLDFPFSGRLFPPAPGPSLKQPENDALTGRGADRIET